MHVNQTQTYKALTPNVRFMIDNGAENLTIAELKAIVKEHDLTVKGTNKAAPKTRPAVSTG